MQATAQHCLTEQEVLNDLLSSQKFLTGVYNTYLCETATSTVRNCLASILAEEHRIQEEIFGEMQTKGFYPLEKAQESKISSAKQKFSGFASR